MIFVFNSFEGMQFNLLSKLALGITAAFLIGGSVCYVVNNDKSDACYITFAISLSMCVVIVAFSIFFAIVEYFDPYSSPNPFWVWPFITSSPSAISSGPILPLGRLSSLPSSPSKILVSRRTP